MIDQADHPGCHKKDPKQNKQAEADDKGIPYLPQEPDLPHFRLNGRHGRRLDVILLAHVPHPNREPARNLVRNSGT